MTSVAWWRGRRAGCKGGALILPALLLGTALLGQAAAGSAANAPGVGSANGAIFVAGGIGETEQAQLAARESEFNLKLVFSLVEGNYVADVAVFVRDSRGAIVVEHVAEGPIFMARLPAGRYRLAATYGGKTLVREVSVNASRLRTEYLRWPADPANDLPVSRWLDKD